MKRTRKTMRVRKSRFAQLIERKAMGAAKAAEKARLDAALASGDAVQLGPEDDNPIVEIKLNPEQIKEVEDFVKQEVAEREKGIIGDLTRLLWRMVVEQLNSPVYHPSDLVEFGDRPDTLAVLEYFRKIGFLEKAQSDVKEERIHIYFVTDKAKNNKAA